MMKRQPTSNRVALYARVSTTALHNGKAQDPELQLRDLKGYVKLRGWRVVGEYVDHISSAKKDRPELQRLMVDAQNQKFDTVACWRFDRFARSAVELGTALEQFKQLGIAFVSMTEQVDTSSPTGELVLTILGAVAKMEREMIRERVRAGIRNRRAKGKHIGPPGAKKITQEMFNKAHDLRKKELTLRAIGNKLGLSAMTVWKLLKREQL
jgi:DNA invertase Pin-like site-specific DNA recombinase